MIGPTSQGIQDLIALDPSADWGQDGQWRRRRSGGVHGGEHPCGISPRVVAIPVFNPDTWDLGPSSTGRTTSRDRQRVIGFFIDRMQGNDVDRRI